MILCNLSEGRGLATVAPKTTVFLLLGIGTTHLYRNFILRKNWLSLKVIQVIPRIITGSIVVGLILLICTQIIVLVIDNIPIYKLLNPIQRIENLTGQFITVFIWSVLYFAYHFFEKSRKTEFPQSFIWLDEWCYLFASSKKVK